LDAEAGVVSPTHTPLRWRAWAGLVAAPLAWALHHQIGSDANFTDCDRGDGGVAIAVGLAALVLSLLGGALSLSAWRRAGQAEGPGLGSDRFIAALSLLACALFSLTITVQIMAGVILPACFR
jgi:hypothetical protein